MGEEMKTVASQLMKTNTEQMEMAVVYTEQQEKLEKSFRELADTTSEEKQRMQGVLQVQCNSFQGALTKLDLTILIPNRAVLRFVRNKSTRTRDRKSGAPCWANVWGTCAHHKRISMNV